MSSAFAEWFVAQHGPRPTIGGSDADLLHSISSGKTAQRLLDQRRAWDMQYTSALYAWQARENRHTGRG